MSIEVLDGGLLTTIQDHGRPGHGHLGVPESGAADPISLAIANRLVGNEPGVAALELTRVGGSYRVEASLTIGLAGADLGARIRGGPRLVPGRSHRVSAGDILDVPGNASAGCRLYLAVPGGFDVPVLLGSRSTCLSGGFGGLDGRPIRAGDRVAGLAGHEDVSSRSLAGRLWPTAAGDPAPVADTASTLRIIAFDPSVADALTSRGWRVAEAADRVGTRLEPADGGALDPTLGGETVSHGVPWGAIQVPPDGQPIVLGPDHGTTGGYRVAAVVITADRPVLGQLVPGADVRLVRVHRDEALAALRAEQAALEAGVAALRESARWDALAVEAGA